MRIGHLKTVENKLQKFNESNKYVTVKCIENGKKVKLAFLKNDIIEAKNRALRNNEDFGIEFSFKRLVRKLFLLK